jgi:hypothetical protein
MVTLSRSDFTPEDWAKISPGNGPCTDRPYRELDLKPLAQIVGSTKSRKIVFKPEVEPYDGPPSPKPLVIGDIYTSRRSTQRQYRVIGIMGENVQIKSLDSGEAWWTTRKSLSSRFTKEA